MRNLRKYLALLIVVAMMAVAIVPVFAQDEESVDEEYVYENEAVSLNNLGLYDGIAPVDEEFDPDLGSLVTREQGITMLVRMLGQRDSAEALSEYAISSALKDFNDAEGISDWARPYMAFAVAAGYVKGTPEKDLLPQSALLGKALCTLILRAMGYVDPEYAVAAAILAEKGGLSALEAVKFNDKELIRDDLVGIIFGSLVAEDADGVIVIDKLIAAGIVTEAAAMDAGLIEEVVIASVNSIADVTCQVGTAPVLPTTVVVKMSNGELANANVIWDAVDVSAAGTIAVSGTVAGSEDGAVIRVVVTALPTPTPVPVVPLAVVSAAGSADITDIVVTFNKAVDATLVVGANFTIGGVAAAVVPSADLKSVLVTVPVPAVANPADYALVVKAAVGIAADYTKTVRVIDTAIPLVVGAALSAPTEFVITFNEQVQNTGAVLLNNGTYSAVAAAPVGKTVTVTIPALAAGEYTVKVTGYKDFAGFAIDPKETPLVYAADTSALTAAITSATQESVVVTFNKAIATTLTVGHFYHTFSAWAPNSVTASADKKSYTLAFTTYKIAQGSYNLVVKATDGTSAITDAWGNSYAGGTLPGSVTADTTPPTVALTEVTDEQTIKVTYSEAVAGANTVANYVVKNAAGVASTVNSVTNAGNVYTINLAAKLAGGACTIAISNVTDAALTANTIVPVTLTATITDKTRPTITAVSYVDAADAEYIYVTFSEAMSDSVMALNNYRQNNVAPTAIAAFGANKIKISFPNGTTLAGADFVYGQLADVATNKINDNLSTVRALVVGDAEAAPGITSITTKSLNTIQIVVNKVIPSLVASGITVTKSNGGDPETFTTKSPAIISYSNDGTATTIVATMTSDTAIANSAAKPYKVNILADALVSDTGKKNVATEVLAAAIVDGIAASWASNTAVSTTVFKVTFNENIATTNAAMVATDLTVVKADGTVLLAGVDYSTAVAGANITVTLAAAYTGKLTISSKAALAYVKGADGNALNAFSGKEVTLAP